MTTILTKKKDTTGAPAAGDLTNAAGGAELAVNTFDKRLYSKDSGGNVVEIGTNPTILDVDNIQINGNTISSTNSNGNITMTPNGTGAVAISKVDIAAGEIDGVTIGTNSAVTDLRVDNLQLNGNTISSTDSNGNVVIAPNGSGDVQLDADTVRVGDSGANATITTNGTGDLILNTNSGTNSGFVRIYDAANGFIVVEPNGTGKVAIGTPSVTVGSILDSSNVNVRGGSVGETSGDVKKAFQIQYEAGTTNGVAFAARAYRFQSASGWQYTGLSWNIDVDNTDNVYPDVLAFQTGNGGRVGIGTRTPNLYGKLSVAIAGDTSLALVDTSSAGTNNLNFTAYNSGATNSDSVIGRISCTSENGGQAIGSMALWYKATGVAIAQGLVLQSDGHVRPGADNTKSIGTASYRWSEVFAGNGTINTSDARVKTAVAPFTAAEMAAAKDLAREIGTFQFLASVASKGADGARTHIGMTVQRAVEIMESHGLDAMKYGFICYDKWDDVVQHHPAKYKENPDIPGGDPVLVSEERDEVVREAGDSYGFRVDQLLMFIARGFEARLSALEAGG